MKVSVVLEFTDENLPDGLHSLEFQVQVPKNLDIEKLANVKIVIPVFETKTFKVRNECSD